MTKRGEDELNGVEKLPQVIDSSDQNKRVKSDSPPSPTVVAVTTMEGRGEDESRKPEEKNSDDDSKNSGIVEVVPVPLATWKTVRGNNSGLRFEASGLPGTDFCTFVEKNSKEEVVGFFREVVDEVEKKRGVKDFHFKVREKGQWFCVEVYYGEEKEGPAEAKPGECISCFADAPLFPGMEPVVTAGECVLAEFSDQPYVKCSMDAKARSGFVVTPTRHVERMSDLDNEELFALWNVAVRALRQDSLPFRTMIVNHGTYRNTPHLHLKVWVDDQLHTQLRTKWSSEKMDLWNRLLAVVATVPKKPCRNFQERGHCWYGEGCRFPHVLKPDSKV